MPTLCSFTRKVKRFTPRAKWMYAQKTKTRNVMISALSAALQWRGLYKPTFKLRECFPNHPLYWKETLGESSQMAHYSLAVISKVYNSRNASTWDTDLLCVHRTKYAVDVHPATKKKAHVVAIRQYVLRFLSTSFFQVGCSSFVRITFC